jgi:tetratricopeptide (TPR) repeat protein
MIGSMLRKPPHRSPSARRRALLLCAAPVAGPAWALPAPDAVRLVADATQLIDTHFGDDDKLAAADRLLQRAVAQEPSNAGACLQLARLGMARHGRDTGHYRHWLDRALRLDPGEAKVHLLAAELHALQGDQHARRAALDQARALGSAKNDPWLSIGYARFHGDQGDWALARQLYLRVEAAGPGANPSTRQAYITALTRLAHFTTVSRDPQRLRALAAQAARERHPDDAWVLGSFAARFVAVGLFEDAVTQARAALRVMNHTAARLTLAAGLYGQAAALIRADRTGAAAPLIDEARALGLDGRRVLERLSHGSEPVQALMPVLKEIIP